jgi:hypothetical protein
MKNFILILSIIAFVGCKEETPTEPKITIQKEYTLEELENDTNWVEITDIDTTEKICVWGSIIMHGKEVNSSVELDTLYKLSEELGFGLPYRCVMTDSLDVNFQTRTMLLFWIDFHKDRIERRIYKNTIAKKYLYLAIVHNYVTNLDNSTFYESITIPKVSNDYSIVFDSLRIKDE